MLAHQTPWLELIDTRQFGVRRVGAAYLIRGKQLALVETGTPRAALRLCDALRGVDLSFVFVSHAHLDHAGGAGFLAADHPNATVVAHPRAVPHLADPRRLVEGLRRASGALSSLYGDPVAVPADRLHPASDGDRFDLGRGIVIETIDSPGHAPHHLCVFERKHGYLFTGDSVGLHNVSVDLPLTVPPRFDLEASEMTIDRLRRSEPRRLAFTHFGVADEPPRCLFDRYERALAAWFERLRSLRQSVSDAGVIRAVLSEPQYASLPETDRVFVEMCVRGALQSLSPEGT